MRSLRVLGCALLAVAVLSGTATAAEPLPTLRVVVVDAKTQAPLALARVEIYGPRSLRGSSGPDGAVPFAGIDPGTYDIVVRHGGYDDRTIRAVALQGAGDTVTVALQPSPRRPPTWLREIGRSRVKLGSKASTTTAAGDTPEQTLRQDAAAGVGTIPGVTLNGTPGGQTVSVFGHSPAQTTFTVDGTPVGPLGGVGNVQPFSLDLFQSIDVARQSAFGSPGGNVNFTTRDPALDWIGTFASAFGTFANNGERFTGSGTSGRLGISFTHARRDEVNPLNGLTFLDASGVRYQHDATVQNGGDALKLRYPFSQNHALYATLLEISSRSPLFCTQDTGPLPCGFGPVNVQSSSLTSAQLRDVFSAGRLDASLTLFRNRAAIDVDQSGRYISGVPFPSSSSARSTTTGLVLDGQYQVGRGYPISFHATTDTQTSTLRGTAFGSAVPPFATGLSYQDVSLSGSLFERRRLSSTLSLGMQHQGDQHNTTAGLSLRYRPGSADTLTVEERTGLIASVPATFNGVADPSALQIDCASHHAAGLGPSSGASSSGSSTTTLTYQHSGPRVSFTATARHEVDRNGAVSAFVRGDSLPASLYDPTYFNRLSSAYDAACGDSRTLGPSDVFLQTTASASRVVYDGGAVALHLDLSRNLAADVSEGLVYARASGAGGPLFGTGSTVISGNQLPNVPIHTTNVALTAQLGNGQTRALLDAHVVGSNNANNLPGYMTLDAGIDRRLKGGAHVTLSALNVTGAYAGIFATPSNAVPLPIRGGSFATVALPLAPRTVQLAVQLPFGVGASLEDVPDITAGPQSYGYKLYPYDRAVPRDAFEIDRRSGRCGPEVVGPATHELSLIRDYVGRIEARRLADGSPPAAMPSETHDGLVLTFRRTMRSYAVMVAPDMNLSYTQQIPVLRPIAGCARFYSGTLAETGRLGLYIPTYDELREMRPLAEYAPAVGFYVPPSRLENDRLFPAYTDPPKTPPADPFAISASPVECLSSARSGADAFVALLKPYVTALYAGQEAKQPAGFTIVDHRDGKNRWLEIASPDLDVKMLAGCLSVAAIDQKAADALGIGGNAPPALDYTRALGFYNKF